MLKKLLLLIICLSVLISGCGTAQQKNTEGSSGNTAAQSGAVEATTANDGTNNGIDMSKKYKVTLMCFGWRNQPVGDDDPFKAWIDKKYNIDYNLIAVPGGDLQDKAAVAYASGNPPDILFHWDKALFLKFYDQGLLAEDATPFLEKLPTLKKSLTDSAAFTFCSKDGKMFAVPRPAGGDRWEFTIRKDWLANLNLQAPKTADELLDVLRKFTFNDPDKNGKNDTWGISGAGSGQNLNDLAALGLMYGPGNTMGIKANSSIYLDTNKQIQSSILDGSHKSMLDFIKTCVDEKLMDPDFYTQGWEQRKTKLYSGKIGVAYYPPSAIINETELFNNNDGKGEAWWESIGIPKGSDNGGKRNPRSPVSGLYAISATTAQDKDKLDRILYFLDDAQYPNEGYNALRWGIGILPGKEIKEADGIKYISLKDDPRNGSMPGGWDYGVISEFTGIDGILQVNTDAPNSTNIYGQAQQIKANAAEDYGSDHASFLNLDPNLTS